MSHKLNEFLENQTPLSEIATYLDGLGNKQGVSVISEIPRKQLKKLYEIAKADLELSDIIPNDYPELREVIFYGCNSLPLNRNFQKRMCRISSGLMGYNHQNLMCLSGPGYFVINQQTERPGQVMIDYTAIPNLKPQAWPVITDNESGISRLVYGGMKDFLKRVSRNVFIGEACKKGKSINQYFILYRCLL
jgi:hypothetical protein